MLVTSEDDVRGMIGDMDRWDFSNWSNESTKVCALPHRLLCLEQ